MFPSLPRSLAPLQDPLAHPRLSIRDRWMRRSIAACFASRVPLIGRGDGGRTPALISGLLSSHLALASRLPPRLFISLQLIVNDDGPKCSDRKVLITGAVGHLRSHLDTQSNLCACVCVWTVVSFVSLLILVRFCQSVPEGNTKLSEGADEVPLIIWSDLS